MRSFSRYGAVGSNGKTAASGVEPTGDILELISAYEAKAAAGPDRSDRGRNVAKIELHKNIWIIGFLAPLPRYCS